MTKQEQIIAPRYWVHMTRVETGQTIRFEGAFGWSENTYCWWTEGNFECDCNRIEAFLEAGGDIGDDDRDACTSGRYHVSHFELEDGTTWLCDEPEGYQGPRPFDGAA